MRAGGTSFCTLVADDDLLMGGGGDERAWCELGGDDDKGCGTVKERNVQD